MGEGIGTRERQGNPRTVWGTLSPPHHGKGPLRRRGPQPFGATAGLCTADWWAASSLPTLAEDLKGGERGVEELRVLSGCRWEPQAAAGGGGVGAVQE